ncbi:Ig-like domain-containing protein [Blautia producta]|nr:Ig-like domain-containing protein [uncultured Blautia sp.]MCQ4869989.1 Ig-like domain-containing protein [Blautia producta]
MAFKLVRQPKGRNMKLKSYFIKTMAICLTGAMLASTPATLQDVNAAAWKKNSTGWWWQEDNGSYPQNAFKQVNGQTYYFDGRGYMVTGWKKVNNNWYYFNPNGAMATGWKQAGNTWYYLNGSGIMQTGWLKLGNTWYYLNGSGAMLTGWQRIGGNWYYMNDSGSMLEGGWHWINGKCYYMYGSGAMAANTWIGQYYVDGSGAWIQSYQPAHWIQSGSRWWYRHSDGGYTRNAWEMINGKWYHFDGSGWMQTGWLQLGSTWYYLENSGAMAENKWVGDYYLTGSGAMAIDQWIGNKYVDSNGKWDRSKKKTVALKSISLNKNNLSLTEGDKSMLTVTYNPKNTTVSKAVSWTSSNTKVATVKNGTVLAKGAGTATITAMVNGKKATCAVTVKKKEIPLQSISLNNTSLKLEKGQTDTLKVTYSPSNTTDNKDITWTSSDETIATVKNGIVTAVSDGTATITAAVGKKSASCKIKVYTPVPLDSISLSEQNLNWDITLQDETTLIVTYDPVDTTDDKKVTWSSSDENVVRVTGTGEDQETALVVAEGPGTATITAKVGNKKAECKVDFTASLNKWTLNEHNLELDKGETKQLTITFIPDYTTDPKDTTWSSSDESVATVDENGVVTAISEGIATITAINANGTMDECKVTVSIPRVPAESLSLTSSSEKDFAIINVEQQDTLLATYGPENTTDRLSWSSSDESIATVQDGVVTGISSGECVITAQIGELTAECNICVPYYFGNMDFAHEVFDEINRVRVENGLHAYEWYEKIGDYGAKIVAGYDIMTGTTSKDYANHAGQIGVGIEGDIDAHSVVQAWLNSPMHRGTILDPDEDIKTGVVAVAQKALNPEKTTIVGTSIIFGQGGSKEYLDSLDWSYDDDAFLNIMQEVDRTKIQQYLSIY